MRQITKPGNKIDKTYTFAGTPVVDFPTCTASCSVNIIIVPIHAAALPIIFEIVRISPSRPPFPSPSVLVQPAGSVSLPTVIGMMTATFESFCGRLLPVPPSASSLHPSCRTVARYHRGPSSLSSDVLVSHRRGETWRGLALARPSSSPLFYRMPREMESSSVPPPSHAY